MRRLVLVSIVVLIAICALGCSSSGSGKKGKGGLSENDINSKYEDRFGEGSIPLAEAEGMFRDIKFTYDSSEIDDMARQDIEYNVEIMQRSPELQLMLEGHCDERGTAEYNLALGADRSLAVSRVVQSLGIPSSRVRTISYGEEVPLDPNHDEGAWAKNRRVHFAAHTGQ